MNDSILRVTDELSIPTSELSFRASRSGGPGGQHVNTSSTRVELIWDVQNSSSLDEAQRDRLRHGLAGRISGEGLLTLASSTSRSQARNREEVTERFVQLLRDALRVPKPRKKTRPPRAAREKRLADKKRRSEIKKLREPPAQD